MQCQVCNKPATVHLTEIIDGHKKERHLCQACSQKAGITIKMSSPSKSMLNDFVASKKDVSNISEQLCDYCMLTWEQFRKHGVLGCSHDYDAFGEPLQKLIAKAQGGATKHVGRIPDYVNGSGDNQLRLIQLRQELYDAVAAEDYEMAARLRDEINHVIPPL
jgi:protein arginine kinase activator